MKSKLAAAHAANADTQALEQASRSQPAHLEDVLSEAERELRRATDKAEFFPPIIDELQSRNTVLEQQLAEQRSITERLASDKLALQESIITLRDKNCLLLSRVDEIQAIEASTTWRATAGFRAAAERLPQPVRWHLRRAAKAGYWALTPHKLPARLKFLRERKRAEASPERKEFPGDLSNIRPASLPIVSATSPVVHYIDHGPSERLRRPGASNITFLPNIMKEDRETVLVIAHEASRTGAPILAWNLVKRLNTQYNVVVLLKRGGGLVTAFERQAVAVIRLPEGAENLPDKVYGIVEWLVSIFRVKYAIANSAETGLFIGALEENRVPVIALVHEFAEYTGPVLDQVYEAASTVVFPSSIVASSSLAKYPALAIRGFTVISQGLCEVPSKSESEFELLGDDPTTGSVVLNDDKACFLVVGMGAIQIRKGVDLFIAIASLARRLPGERKIAFLWVGHGYRPDEDLAYSAYLRDQIIRSDLRNRLEILDEVADLKPIYDRADLFLLTSRLDPLPNVAIEAALRGLPVICFDRASGLAELLEQNGATRDLVVPYLDCNAAARLVSELAVDPVRLSKRSEAIQSLAKSTFDMARYVDAIDALGRAASSRLSQIERDAALIVSEKAFDPELFLGPEAAFLTYNSAVLRYLNKSKLLSAWSEPNAGLMLRRPFAGFHPLIYAAENASFGGTTAEDPLAHFLRTGRPKGRWAHSVIRPEDFRSDEPATVRAAIHGHFHYAELLEEFLNRLAPNRTHFDLFLTTHGVERAAVLRDVVTQFSMTEVDIRVVPNRGRDIGPLLSELADELQGYDVIGHMHGKRSKHITQHGDRWRSFLWDHLLGSSFPMVDIILKVFETDATLGLVFPEDPHLNDWNENRLIAEDLARHMGITDPLPTHFDFPIGTMFWARPAALRPLFSLGLRWDDYPIEPLSEDGTILHALERLITFAANDSGFRYATTFVPGSTR